MQSLKIIGVLVGCLALWSCGGDDAPGPATGVSENAGVSVDGQSSAPLPSVSAPRQKSTRLDEHGNIIGVYGAPYVPNKTK